MEHIANGGCLWYKDSRENASLCCLLFVRISGYIADNGEQRYSYTYNCALNDFAAASYEEIRSRYGKRVLQDDTDSIVDREVKFFVWPEQELWGFMVVPIYQSGDSLMLGREEFYPFENDNWVRNFFDGTK